MRKDNWQSAYAEAIALAMETRFEWGKHDCVLFCGRVVDAISDRNVTQRMLAEYQWSSAREAYEIITVAGGLQALVTEMMGDPAPWVRCSTGDVVLARNEDGSDIVTIHDGHNLITVGGTGLGSLPMSASILGWIT